MSNVEKMKRWQQGEFDLAPVTKLLGIHPLEIAEGEITLGMVADERMANPMGTLHGGIITDLADMAMGCVVASVLGADEGFTTQELSTKFLRPFRQGELSARAYLVRRGRNSAYLECDIKTSEGKLIARAMSTCMIFKL